jgi:hypothetical protein
MSLGHRGSPLLSPLPKQQNHAGAFQGTNDRVLEVLSGSNVAREDPARNFSLLDFCDEPVSGILMSRSATYETWSAIRPDASIRDFSSYSNKTAAQPEYTLSRFVAPDLPYLLRKV